MDMYNSRTLFFILLFYFKIVSSPSPTSLVFLLFRSFVVLRLCLWGVVLRRDGLTRFCVPFSYKDKSTLVLTNEVPSRNSQSI